MMMKLEAASDTAAIINDNDDIFTTSYYTVRAVV